MEGKDNGSESAKELKTKITSTELQALCEEIKNGDMRLIRGQCLGSIS